MQRTRTHIFVAALLLSSVVLSVFAPASVAFAQDYTTGGGADTGSAPQVSSSPYVSAQQPIYQNASNPTTGGTSVNQNSNSTPGNTSQPIQAATDPGSNSKTPIDLCSWSQPSMCIAGVVYWFAVSIPSFYIWAGALAFGAAMELTLDSNSYAMGFVSAGWTTARDVANMVFLFVLVYVAINVMFSLQTGGTMQTLMKVVVFALIINFSFFGTRLVIDAGNIAAVQIYNVLPNSTPPPGSILASLHAKDLSLGIMNGIGVQGLLSGSAFASFQTAASKGNSFLSNSIMLSVVFISIGVVLVVVGTAFFVATVHLVTRLVVLWLLIVASPLAFAAATVKPLEGKFKEWLNALIKHAMYPFYFLGVYLLLLIFMAGFKNVSLLGGSSGGGGFAGLALGAAAQGLNSGQGQNFTIVLGSTIATIAILATITVVTIKFALSFADKMGLASSKAAQNVGGFLQKQVVGRYTGALRATGGFVADRTAGKAYRERVGRAGMVLDKKFSRTWLGNTEAGTALRTSVLQPLAASKPFKITSQKEVVEARAKRYQSYETGRKEGESISLLKEAALDPKTFAKDKDKMEKLGKIKDEKYLGSLDAPLSASQMKSLAQLLDQSQIDAITKGVKYTPTQRDEIEAEYLKKFSELAENIHKDLINPANRPEAEQKADLEKLRDTGEAGIHAMKESQLEAIAEKLSDKHVGFLDKHEGLSETARSKIKDARDERRTKAIVKELKDIHAIIGRDLGRSIQQLGELHAAGNVVDKGKITKALSAVNTELASSRVRVGAQTRLIAQKQSLGQDVTQEQADLQKLKTISDNLQKAVKSVDKMQGSLKGKSLAVPDVA